MTKTELEAKKVKELEEICKERNLPRYKGKAKLNKTQMIENIMNTEVNSVDEVEVKTSESDLAKVFSENVTEVKIDRDSKNDYLDKAEIGAIVAFWDENGKARSAAIKNKSTKNRKLKLETEFGREFIVPYEKVMWVKTKNRWPKGVYDALKGRV